MSAGMKAIALVVLGTVQVIAAAWSIGRYESTLASGTQYKMRVQPVDPADAFRGRYVVVQPALAVIGPRTRETEELLYAVILHTGKAFVVLGVDDQGFARAERIVREPPPDVNYLAIDSVWQTWNPGGTTATGYTVSFPFTRYYMNEFAAPAAQRRYVEATRRNAAGSAWLTVRVKNGLGVIEGLFVNGVPIEQIVMEAGR